MTHKEAINALVNVRGGSFMTAYEQLLYVRVMKRYFKGGWDSKGKIPLIHIPEVARIIGVKPSEIDPYFIGKDDIVIDWRNENV